MKKLLFPVVLLLSLLLLSGCAAKTRTIELKGNATTGYAWEYTMRDEGIVRETEHGYEDGNIPGTEGAGGIFQFAFEGIAPGETELYFQYHRPFEENADPASTVTYYVVVDQNGNIAECKPTGATLGGEPLKDVVKEKLAEKTEG